MKLLVLDGNSIINRAFYGIKLLSTKEGVYTNALYGFLNILGKLRDDVAPDAAAVAFDLPAPTFRHKAYADYKAGRRPMPEELKQQMPVLKQMLDLMGIKRLEAEGFEADDILGTEAAACSAAGNECFIATGDRDSLQLVGGGVKVMLAGTKAGRPETTVYDTDKIDETYGIAPRQLIEVKALMGDHSDNIPGVPGIGEKTALDLIKRFGSVEKIYSSLDTLDIKPGVRLKLENGRESAAMSRELAIIRTDAPVTTDINELIPAPQDEAGLYKLLAKLEFFKYIEKTGLRPDGGAGAGKTADAAAVSVVAAESADALKEKCLNDKRADVCAVYSKDFVPEAAAVRSNGGLYCALPDRTAGYNGLLAALAGDESITLRTHDIKKLWRSLLASGEKINRDPRTVFDTMLAGYLLNPLASSYEPQRLCAELGIAAPEPDAGTLPAAAADSARDALAVSVCADEMARRLRDNGQEKLYYDIELPLAGVLAEMEHTGFRVDADGIAAYGAQLGEKLDAMQEQIYGMAGYSFNINSTKQLGEALFIKLGLPAKKRTKTGFSTNADVLESLRSYHPIVGVILEYRQLAKLKSTYTDGLVKVIGPDGRIHTSFTQTETRTGRISSVEPNLQNIPVRSEAGRELRRFFIPADGCVLIDADYSQIELRLLAHIADDKAMIEAFNNGVDIHTLTASQVFKMPLDFVTPVMRSRAKAVNFGIVYGIGAYSLSQDIGVSVKEADSYIKNYLDTFSGVRGYMEQIIKQAYDKGYVETLLGRRRALPELASTNRNIRAFGERVARNTPIQGTAADVIKIAMIRVRDRLAREGLRSRLILQVHDELIVEAPQDEVITASQIVSEEMENAMSLRVKLKADVHAGQSWYDAKA